MKKISTLLKIIATGSASLLLSACYGVQQQIDPMRRVKAKVKTQSSDSKPVSNIQISCKISSYPEKWIPVDTTDTDGIAAIDINIDASTPLIVRADDIDSIINGNYKSQIVTVDDSIKTIVMENK